MAKINLKKEDLPFDWFSFSTVVSHLLTPASYSLFTHLSLMNFLNTKTKSDLENPASSILMNNLPIAWKKSLTELESWGLIEVGDSNSLLLKSLPTVRELISEERTIKKLQEKMCSTLLKSLISHFSLETVDHDFCIPHNITEDLSIDLDPSLIREYYHSIYLSLSEEFKVSDLVWELLKKYVVEEKSIKLTSFQKLSVASLREAGIKYICPSTLQFLINCKLEPDIKVEKKDHLSFWKNLTSMCDQELSARCQSLFQMETQKFYQQLLHKMNPPKTLKEWIYKCHTHQHIDFPVLNACISFTKVWIRQVPVTYLDKITSQFHNNGLSTMEELINHFKAIIFHDMGKDNKLGIVHADENIEFQKLFS